MFPLAPLPELETRIERPEGKHLTASSILQKLFYIPYRFLSSGEKKIQESPVIPAPPVRRRAYLLGRDSNESKRLSDQHQVLLKAAGGYIPIPLSVPPEKIETILDIGTGNAQWLVDLRQSGVIPAEVELCGVDVSDQMMPDLEIRRDFRLNLEVRDLCEPFPAAWNQKFDYIHGRHVLIWIEPEKWPLALSNLKQILKPGGTILIIYPGDVPYDARTEQPLEVESAPRKLFSAFVKHTASRGLPRAAAATLPQVLREVGFEPESIVHEIKRVNMGKAEPDVALRPASSHHLDLVIEMLTKLQTSKELGCPSHDDNLGWSQLIEDWRAATDEGIYYNLHVIAGRKPSD